MVEVQEMVLSVPEVSCEHCVKTINNTLGALPGVETVTTDIPTKIVRLRYSPNHISLEQVKAALHDAGYTVAR